MKKSIISILIIVNVILFEQNTLSQPTMQRYCIAITNSNTIVKGRCSSFNSEGEFIKKVTIKDSLNRKIKLDVKSLQMLLSSDKPFSTIDQLNDKSGLVFESLTIDNKNMGLAQLLNWKTSGKLKAYYGPSINKNAIPKGLFGMEDGFEYEEQAFWISKQGANTVLISKKNFEAELNLFFLDCPAFHVVFKKTNAKYKELLTYINDYNRLCAEIHR